MSGETTKESPYKGKTGWRRLINAYGYSLDGLQAAYSHEDAFRQEVWGGVVLIVIAIFLPVGLLGKALLIGSVLLVLIVELLNSAIEAVVDRISFDHHHLAKRAKDIGSAAVLLGLLNAAAIWVCVLLD